MHFPVGGNAKGKPLFAPSGIAVYLKPKEGIKVSLERPGAGDKQSLP